MTGSRGRLALILLGLAASSLAVAISERRLVQARGDFAAAQIALQQAAGDAQEIMDLRAARQTVESHQRPTQDVIAQVNSVLADVGIPSRALRSLAPESEGSAVASAPTAQGGRLLQQSLRLVLEDLTPEQVGAWLAQWRIAQPIWTPTRIELAHSRIAGAGEAVNRDGNRYDATILLTALYLADEPPPPPQPPRPASSSLPHSQIVAGRGQETP